MKKIGLLGSTGSIGTQTLNVLDQLKEKFDVKYLTSNNNAKLLSKQAKKYNPDTICIVNNDKKDELISYIGNSDIKITSGRESLLEISSRSDIDLVVNGLVGAIGMEPTIFSIKAGIDIALANKESLVMAGQIINNLLKKSNSNIYPVDSEHSAIWQCLKGEKNNQIKKIILTGSGGPFRKLSISEFKFITIENALKHPNWSMGNKITIDSATMMNKGLEVIEAYWLFNLDISQIEIVIHPQSIIHSLVEFKDGSIKAQLGIPDMRIPIQYAITYPDHISSIYEPLDLIKVGNISFEKPNTRKFPCIQLAYDALREGGSFPIVLNIANDIAVDAFLNKYIEFNDIPKLIENSLNSHKFIKNPNLETINSISKWTKSYIHDQIKLINNNKIIMS